MVLNSTSPIINTST